MRCPKCRYIGFEDNDQCRNCGYDFSLSRTESPLDLPIRGGEPVGPMADLRLTAADRRRSSSAALTPPPDLEAETGARRSLTPGFDLPLFNDARDDVPLVDGNAAPRPPLAVRRAAPVTPRVRIEAPVREEPALDFPEVTAPPPQARHNVPRATGVVDTGTLASAGARLVGAAVDALIIGVIDAAVLYFTLEICGLQFADVRALPVVPMLAFLIILNGGYLTMFTAAGGQTIGKMAARTRVVPAAPGDHAQGLRFGTALVRAAACLVSILPAGAGFFMALFRADGRALHDAIADTRVIRA